MRGGLPARRWPADRWWDRVVDSALGVVGAPVSLVRSVVEQVVPRLPGPVVRRSGSERREVPES